MDQHRAALSHFETSRDSSEHASSFVPAVSAVSPEKGRAIGSRLAKLRWYAARLAAMSPREIVHRVGEMKARRRLAGHADGWNGVKLSGLADVNLSQLQAALAGLQAGPVADRLTLLGKTWPRGNGRFGVLAGEQWFFDPVSQRLWPDARQSAFAVDVRSTSTQPGPGRPYGDVKYDWEANRLQMLHPLACRIAREGVGSTAWREAITWVGSWMEANPPYRGVNWSSGIEISLRALSVAFVVAAAGPQRIKGADRDLLARFIAAHGAWLGALPSLHSSANNHRVAEGLGLLVCGMLLEGHTAYVDEGRAVLQGECMRQILPDGVGVEHRRPIRRSRWN